MDTNNIKECTTNDKNDSLSVILSNCILDYIDKHPQTQAEEIINSVQLATNVVLTKSFANTIQKRRLSVSLLDDTAEKKLTRGYIDGCFDIMHSGHFNAIRQAKSLCDILVVGVHSHKEILKHKGPPVMTNAERLASVKACKWVDEVVFDTPYDPSIELLDVLNCDFSVHGDDMSTTSDGFDAYASVKQAGRLKIIKRTEGISTTDLVGRLLLMTKTHHIARSDSHPTISGESTLQITQTSTSDSIQINDTYNNRSSIFLPTTWRIACFSNNRTPKEDDVVIYIDGAFDLFHTGHIDAIMKAKEMGSFLLVGVHDDDTVNKHRGHNYPIMNLHERVLNVLSCRYVDEVIIGAPWQVSKDMLTTFRISKVVAGEQMKLRLSGRKVELIDPYVVPKQLEMFVELKTSNDLTTEGVVNRIIENRIKYSNRNKNRVAKDIEYQNHKEFVVEI